MAPYDQAEPYFIAFGPIDEFIRNAWVTEIVQTRENTASITALEYIEEVYANDSAFPP